jgi:hypothetical protein
MIMCFAGTWVIAQPGDQMQRFREEKIAFFNEKLDLSDKEAQAFWPLHEDLQNRKMKVNEDEKTLLNYYNSNYDAMSEEETRETIKKYMELQDKRHNLNSEYHDKFVRVIGEKKTMRLYALEREFRVHILHKFRAGRGGGHGKGPQWGRD